MSESVTGDDVIRMEGVGRRFGNRWALRGLDLSVAEGSVCGLLGRNGAGKTTTVRLLFGLLRPDEGSLRVAGNAPCRDVVGLRRSVGYAGEDLGFYPRWRVSRVLRFAERAYDDWDADRAKRMVRHFGLQSDRRVRELSSGMRARLGLLLALARRPRVLLLDEPFGGLDVVIRREVVEGLIDVLPEAGSTVLLTSHLVHEMELLVDHVAMLTAGRVTFHGPLESLRASVRRIRLGPTERGIDLDAWPWIRKAERTGRGWELVAFDFHESRLETLKASGFQIEEVLPLDLEDIAYEYLSTEGEEAVA